MYPTFITDMSGVPYHSLLDVKSVFQACFILDPSKFCQKCSEDYENKLFIRIMNISFWTYLKSLSEIPHVFA